MRVPALVATMFALIVAAPAQAIVGGHAAPPGRWPWMVALIHHDADIPPVWDQFCGGVVIAPRRILTAAHCVVDARPRDVEVVLGRPRLSGTDGRIMHVRAIALDPEWLASGYAHHDAAVLALRGRTATPPLELARPGMDAVWARGTPAWTMGWGRLNAHRSPGGSFFFADRLRELALPVQDDDACEGAYGAGWPELPYRPEWLLCAGTAVGLTGVCDGDSGGPLVVEGPSGWLEIGMVEASDDCASRGYYDLFTRTDSVSKFALEPSLFAQPDVIRRPRR